MSCRLMRWRSTGKGTVTCAMLWMKSMILRPGCRGQRWGDTGVCGAAVWGRVALCMAVASCDWLGGNIEKLIRQIA